MPPPTKDILIMKKLARKVSNKAKKYTASTHYPYLGPTRKNGSGKNKRTFKKRTFKKRTFKKRTFKKRTFKKRTFNKRRPSKRNTLRKKR